MPAIRPDTACAPNERAEAETSFTKENVNETITLPVGQEEPVPSFDKYLLSIIFMPHSLRMVCLTNLFCWMAHVRIKTLISTVISISLEIFAIFQF